MEMNTYFGWSAQVCSAADTQTPTGSAKGYVWPLLVQVQGLNVDVWTRDVSGASWHAQTTGAQMLAQTPNRVYQYTPESVVCELVSAVQENDPLLSVNVQQESESSDQVRLTASYNGSRIALIDLYVDNTDSFKQMWDATQEATKDRRRSADQERSGLETQSQELRCEIKKRDTKLQELLLAMKQHNDDKKRRIEELETLVRDLQRRNEELELRGRDLQRISTVAKLESPPREKGQKAKSQDKSAVASAASRFKEPRVAARLDSAGQVEGSSKVKPGLPEDGRDRSKTSGKVSSTVRFLPSSDSD
ncbi:hypothetical protein FVE85_7255 [Porphyridium purpureum]|uniref:Uncharacterized protein n=1 Tax=Porphyridium purpureum TaxID=35688 RepID=A0A5J4Z970_PORPP|nr:hypothetical protein FVE85_7255 [Porphyridium purpureum]|eukprot:POR6112..scf295_1